MLKVFVEAAEVVEVGNAEAANSSANSRCKQASKQARGFVCERREGGDQSDTQTQTHR